MKRQLILLTLMISLAGCTTPAQRQTHKRMESIIIPEIDFQQVNIKDAIDVLYYHYSSLAKPERNEPILGLISNFKPAPSDLQPREIAPNTENIHLITLQAKDIPLLDALNRICKEARITYRIDRDGNIRFEPLRKGPIFRRRQKTT